MAPHLLKQNCSFFHPKTIITGASTAQNMTLNQSVTGMEPMAVDTVQIPYGTDMALVQDITPKVHLTDMVRV